MNSHNSDLVSAGINSLSEKIIGAESYYEGLQVFAPPGVHSAAIDVISNYVHPGARLLELGAGTGAFTLRLKDKRFNVIASGIDQGQFALKEVPYKIIDLNKILPREHLSSYDAVVAIEVIEHVENIFEFMRKVFMILNPGGLAFISTPNITEVRSRLIFLHSGNFSLFSPWLAEDWGHIQILPPWLLQKAAERAKLRLIEMTGIGALRKDLMPLWQKMLSFLAYGLKKCFYKEKFPGEFSSSNILLILKK